MLIHDKYDKKYFYGILGIVFLLLTFVSGVVIHSQINTIRKTQDRELKLIAEHKAGRIENLRNFYLKSGEEILDDSHTLKLLLDPETGALRNKIDTAALRSLAQELTKRYVLAGFKVFTPEGTLKFSMQKAGVFEDDYGRNFFSRRTKLNAPQLSDFHRGVDGAPHLTLIVPIHLHNTVDDKITAVIFAKIDPTNTFYPLLSDWPFESNSSEALLCKVDKDSILYLSNLKYIKNSALNVSVSREDKTKVSVIAADRGDVFIEGHDYRDVETIAYARAISGSDWILIAKTDRTELLTPVYTRIAYIITLIAAIMLALVIGFMMVYRKEKGRLYQDLFVQEQEKNALLIQYDFVVKHANDIIIMVDDRGKLVEVNEKALAAYGYEREELIGSPVEILRENGSSPEVSEILRQLNLNEGMIFETIHARKDGILFPVEVSAKLLSLDGKKFYQSIVRDITERKSNEENISRLNRMYSMLSASNKAIVRKTNMDDLFKEILRISTDLGKFSGVWIGRMGESGSAQKLAAAGETVLAGYILKKVLYKSHMFNVVEKGTETFYCNNVESEKECEEMKVNQGVSNLKSLAVFRLERPGSDPIYVMLMSDKVDRFNESEKVLLNEMAEDLTFALRHFGIEKSLFASEAKFKTMVEESPVGIFIMDEFGRLTYGNPALESIIDREFSVISGYSWLKALHPEDKELIVTKWSMAVEERAEFNAEGRFLRKNGEISYLRAKSSPISTGDTIIGHVGMIFDDTEIMKKQFEVNRFFTAVNQTGSSIVITNLNGEIEYVNPAFETLTGYTADEALGRNPRFLQSGFTPMESYVDMYGRITNGETWRGEFVNRKKSGEIFYESATITPVKDLSGKLINYLAIKEDITKFKAFQKEIEEKNKLIQNVLQLLPVGVWILNADGEIIQGNDAAIKIWGGAKYVGIKNFSVYKAKWLKTGKQIEKDEWAAVRAILHKEISINEEIEIECFDGTTKIIYNSALPILNSDGKVQGAVVVNEDISELKNSQKELIYARDTAEEMNRLKSNFLANMSHELRTPLIGILGFSEILADDDFPEEVKNMAGTINNGGKRLLETLNLILDLSRLEAGKVALKSVSVDAIKISSEVVKHFTGLAENKNLFLKLDTDFRSLKFRSDERMLMSILNNLVNNAVKFTYKGGVTVGIGTGCDKNGKADSVVITVADTGIGISEKDHELIFEEFRQVSEGRSRGFEGSGLGLAIVKKFVEKLDGRISINSTLGEGTVFKVELPAEIDSVESISSIASDQGGDLNKRSSGLKKVLFVENDPLNSEVIMKFLFGAYEVDHTSTGLEAIQRGTSRKYDVILMDINLGGKIDGMIAARQIRAGEINKDTPVVAVTAYASPSSRDEILASGCTHYLSKPFRRGDIIGLLNGIFKGQNE